MKRRMRIRSALALILVFAMLFITAFTNIAASSEFGPPESFGIDDGNTGGEENTDPGANDGSMESTDLNMTDYQPDDQGGESEISNDTLEDIFGTEPQYYNLTGYVTYVDENNNSQAMSGIQIRVYDGTGQASEICTDLNGGFRAENLTAGNYTIQYIANGVFDPAQFTVPDSASGYTVKIPAEGENAEYFALIENVNISSSLNIDLTLTKKAEENILDDHSEETLEGKTEEIPENNSNAADEEIINKNSDVINEETSDDNSNAADEEILNENLDVTNEETSDDNSNVTKDETANDNPDGNSHENSSEEPDDSTNGDSNETPDGNQEENQEETQEDDGEEEHEELNEEVQQDTILANNSYYAEVTFEEIGAQETVELEDYFKDILTCDESIVTANGSNKSVTLTAAGEGETVVTVQCKSKQNGNDGTTSEYAIHVIVKRPETETWTAAGTGYTVKVTGNLKAIPGAKQVIAENIFPGSDEFTSYYLDMAQDLKSDGLEVDTDTAKADETFKFLQMYHIYLADENGKEVEVPSGVNANLKVEIIYDTKPEGLDNSVYVGHYKMNNGIVSRKEISDDGTAYSIGVKRIQVKNNSIVFRIKDFSAITGAVPFPYEENSNEDPGANLPVQNSILTSDMLVENEKSTSNKWQVAYNGYTGNTSSNKTVYGPDGNVRVQKNVIATDIENEFLVYLSIDTKQVFEEYFRHAVYEATTSNNYHSEDLGTIVNAMTGNQEVLVTGDSSKGYSNSAIFTIEDYNGNILAKNVTIYWNQANNVTFYLRLSNGKYILLGVEIKKNDINTVRLSKEAEEYIQEEVTKAANLNQVTDIMGDYIEFQNVVACDGNANYDSDTRKITWIPTVKSNPPREETVVDNTTKTTTIWNLNTAELVYKVRLNVEKEGFNSCANNMDSTVGEPETYAVNNSAVLTYNDNQEVTFPVPYVRGLLYEFKFHKVDSEDTSIRLPGAKFTLTSKSDADKSYTAANTEDGEYNFLRIPWGYYTLEEEIPPTGYQTGAIHSWDITIGFTLDLQDETLEIDKHTHDENSAYYRWIGYYDENNTLQYNSSVLWNIANEKNESPIVVFKKVSAVNTAMVLPGAEFELFDSDRKSLGTMTSGENGIFQLGNYEFTSGVYYLKEIKAPAGYLLLTDEITITVTEDEEKEDKISVNSDKASVTKTTEEDGQETYTVTIMNEAVYNLPSTGGIGIFWYLAGGVLLMMAAALIIYKNKCREVLRS